MPLTSTKSFLRNLFRKRRADQDLDDELRSYLHQLTQEKIAAGASLDHAAREARIELGGIEQVKEQVREIRAGAWLDSLLQDLRYALRTLRKNPAFAAVAILTLALGIGFTTSIFSVVNAVLLEPLPVHDPERVVFIHDQLPEFGVPRTKVSPLQFREFSQHTELFEATAAFKPASLVLTIQERPVRVQAMKATAGLFPLLGVQPILGRVLSDSDDTFGSPHVLVLSEALWTTLFNRDRSIVGKRLRVDGNSYEIVGVLPGKFDTLFFPRAEVWIPAAIDPESTAEKYRWYVDYVMLARLRSGVSLAQARAGMQAALASFNVDAFNFGVDIRPMLDEEVGDMRRPLYILLGAVTLVLLIACLNVGNLLLARNTARRKEIATRISLGAGRGRIIAQLLTESLLLSFIGAVAGLVVAQASLFALIRVGPPDIPRLSSIHLDAPVLIFTFGVSVFAAVLFGLAPALSSARSDLAEPSRSGVHAGGGRQQHRLPRLLVVVEIAIALVLLSGSGLLLRSFAKLLDVPLGFNPNGVLTARVSLSAAISNDPTQFSNTVIDRISALPGVLHAALATGAPFTSDGYSTTFDIRDLHPGPGDPEPHAAVIYVTPGYFHTLQAPLVSGRLFTAADMRAGKWFDKGAVRIIDRALANRFWHDRNPVGSQIGDDDQWATIVGVVGDIRDGDLASQPEGTIYIPGYVGSTLILRTAANPQSLATPIRDQVRAAASDVPVYDVRTMQNLISESLVRRRFAVTLLTLFAALALLLAFIGIYGVIAYLAKLRTHEFGLHMALGAQRSDILGMVFRQSILVTFVGVASGLVLFLAAKPVLASQLFGVSPTDLLTLSLVSTLTIALAALANYIPASRATRVDPMIALRHE
jgi:predicted permease